MFDVKTEKKVPAVRGQKSELKADASFWRLRRQRGRVNDVHHALQNRDDDSLMNIEPLFQFLFQQGKFLSQLALVAEQRAHFEKRAYHKHTHLNRTRAVEHICSHDRTVLSEDIREIFAMLAATSL